MNIAFVIENITNQGGTERVTVGIANGLAQKLINKVHIISLLGTNPPTYSISDSVKRISLGLDGMSRLRRRYIVPRKLKEVLSNHKIDVVICVDVGIFTYLRSIQSRVKCKIVVWEHFNYFNTPRGWRDHRKKVIAARRADAIVVLGEQDLENYRNHITHIKNIRYIYNPIAVTTQYSTDLTSNKVLAVGRLVRQKGFDILLDVWKKVQENNKEWTLDIYGDGPEKSKLLETIYNEKINNVEIHPFTNNIEEKYLNASIFVLPSRYEGFVLVLGEAQAYALPTISFNIHEGPKEVIKDGINGYLINPFDVEMMANALLKLMDNSNLLKYFSENAKMDLKRFSLDRVLEEWENLFREITDENKHSDPNS